MPLPRWVARFNRHVTNRVLSPIARHVPGFGIIIHCGRKSQHEYHTPVNIFRRAGGYFVALTYGPASDWVRNVVANGGCDLETHGHIEHLTQPHLVHDEHPAFVPLIARPILWLGGVYDFLELKLEA